MFLRVSMVNWSVMGDVEGTWEMQGIYEIVSSIILMFIGFPLEGRRSSRDRRYEEANCESKIPKED